ncbi:MAG: 50S ribosomal protein L4 [Candidatus Andersenbacteria bacterium]
MKKLTAPVYSMDGKKIDSITLDSAIFGTPVSPTLLTRAAVAQRNNARQVLAHTKTRAERRGGGRKPWKQKGTGRARQGSIRSPQWRKGGVVFGPRNERNFTLKINRKERRKAIVGALSLAATNEAVIVLDALTLSGIKTKPLATLLGKLPSKRGMLLVLPKHSDNVERSARNIARVKTQLATNLNVLDLMAHATVVIDKAALALVTKTYGGKE